MSDRIRWIPKWVPWKRAFVWWWPFVSEPTIYIPSKRKSDSEWVGRTLAHERVHVHQWKELGRADFLNRYRKKAGRLALEAEAFAESVRWWLQRTGTGSLSLSPQGNYWLDHYAHTLATKYRLPYSVEECKRAIEEWL